MTQFTRRNSMTQDLLIVYLKLLIPYCYVVVAASTHNIVPTVYLELARMLSVTNHPLDACQR